MVRSASQPAPREVKHNWAAGQRFHCTREKIHPEVQTLHTARQRGRPEGPRSAPHGDSAPKIMRLKTFDSMRKHVFLSKY